MTENLACPVKGCGYRRKNTTMLMCWPCWRRVPKLLKNAVWDAYRAWQRQADLAHARDLRLAQQRAIEAVEAKSSEAAG